MAAFVELSMALCECVPLALWLAWLAVKMPLPVAEDEGQLAVAEADGDPLSVVV